MSETFFETDQVVDINMGVGRIFSWEWGNSAFLQTVAIFPRGRQQRWSSILPIWN